MFPLAMSLISLSLYLAIALSIFISISLYIYLSLYLSLYLSIFLSLYIYLSHTLWLDAGVHAVHLMPCGVPLVLYCECGVGCRV